MTGRTGISPRALTRSGVFAVASGVEAGFRPLPRHRLSTCLSPPLLVGALAIWLTDGGPVIYRHRRIGRNGVSFGCLKLRTMVRDSDRALAAHLGRSPAACAEWAANRKLRDDPRVLGKVGRALRRASIENCRSFSTSCAVR